MAINIPSILLHPNKYDFSLDEIEIEYFVDAKKNLLKKYYSLCAKSISKAILNNLKRRVANYGSYEFINSLDEKDKNIYFENSATLSEKLSLINYIVLIKTCFKLNIINTKTYNVLNFFYWFIKDTEENPLSYEDIISSIALLEKNLFKLQIDYIASNKHSKKEEKKPERITIDKRRRKEDYHSINPQPPRRRKSDYTSRTSSNRVKKEDLYMMQQIPQQHRRRKEDFLHSHDVSLKRRKDDYVESENFIPRRRKEDWINQTPRRRKDD